MELCGALMHHRKTLAIACVGLGVLANDLHVVRAENPAVEPKADALLRKMSATLGAMKTFQFDADHVTRVVTQGAEKARFAANSTVVVERPNKFRSERVGPASDVVFTYDRGQVMLYARRLNLIATGQVPDTLDQAIDFARGQLDLDAPAAELLHRDVYASLMKGVVSGRYLGAEGVNGRSCHHLAYRGAATDWQIWIEDGPRPLPCRFLIKRKKAAEAREDAVQFEHWKVGSKLADGAFVFAPPKDAVRIDLLPATAAPHSMK